MTETFSANTGWSFLLYLLFAIVALAITFGLPYAAHRQAKQLGIRTWADLNSFTSGNAPLAVAIFAVVEVFCLFAGLNCALSLTIPNEDSISISAKCITLHSSPEYGFFLNKIPAKDVVIPLEDVVSVTMRADCYGNGESVTSAVAVKGYKNLRITYRLPGTDGLQEEYIDLLYYHNDDQFGMHRCLKKHFPNYATEEGDLDVFKRI